MVKYREGIFIFLIFFFLLFSFLPTLFEISKSNQLKDPSREFILEHNYYWPDFNLYLSKIRQGYEGKILAWERYTSEPHRGSLIQEFYVVLGQIGKIADIEPNYAYQFARLLLSPLLLFIIMMFSIKFFHSLRWQILAFLIVIVSGSFPKVYSDSGGTLHIGRFMEWWSNIDALQRITFIPHILFGQVVSFYLLYRLTTNDQPACPAGRRPTTKRIILYILLGNLVGLVFPPSLITLDGVFLFMLVVHYFTLLINPKFEYRNPKQIRNHKSQFSKLFGIWDLNNWNLFRISDLGFRIYPYISLFILFTLPSLLYLFFTTRTLPWSSLVDFHRTHPMMIPFGEYILGTGPIIFLGLAGAVWSILNKDRKFQPLIFWLLVTFFFAILFTHVKEQSPLRFTQTGLFIPLGILGAYFFQQALNHLGGGRLKQCESHDSPEVKESTTRKWQAFIILLISFYLLGSLFMMTVSLNWQTTWITQRLGANIPPVPYPPQAMYPLKAWMDALRWLRDNTNHSEVVLGEITAGNYIPAYSGNTVYFGQANTVDYERKQQEVWDFFDGKMTPQEANSFLSRGRIKYIFFSIQEKERAPGKDLLEYYPWLKTVYQNPITTIYIN